MRIEKVKAGEVIAKRQDKVMEWFLIQEGTVIQKFEAAEMELNKNSMIGILENDFGAVNVDAVLLQDILGDHCTLEMVAGGCDADCHRRRFKTKK